MARIQAQDSNAIHPNVAPDRRGRRPWCCACDCARGQFLADHVWRSESDAGPGRPHTRSVFGRWITNPISLKISSAA